VCYTSELAKLALCEAPLAAVLSETRQRCASGSLSSVLLVVGTSFTNEVPKRAEAA
jgi:hypothetical protein